MKGAVEPLVKALKDGDAGVRMRAAVALGRIGDPRAVQPLFEALTESDVYARFTMIQALRRLNHWELAADYLKSTYKPIREATVLALTGVYDDGAVKALANAIAAGGDPEMQTRAIEALVVVHRKADPYTGGWWGTQPAAGKPARAKKHDWSGTPIAMTALHDALHQKHDAIRKAAVAALIEIKDPDALPELRTMLADDPSDAVRLEVVHVALAAVARTQPAPRPARPAARGRRIAQRIAAARGRFAAIGTISSPEARLANSACGFRGRRQNADGPRRHGVGHDPRAEIGPRARRRRASPRQPTADRAGQSRRRLCGDSGTSGTSGHR